MGSHTLNKSHRWDVTLSKAKSLDLRSESGFLTQNLRLFVASLLRMTMDAIYGLSKVLLPITNRPDLARKSNFGQSPVNGLYVTA